MEKAIYFDMDGTIANLYGVKDWLPMLQSRNPTPYKRASPLLKMQPLARVLNHLRKNGYTVGIISWLAKDSTQEYDEQVKQAKEKWLAMHLKSVQFDEVHIVAYGTPKQNVVNIPQGILFDDELQNRTNWRGEAYLPENIMDILRALK